MRKLGRRFARRTRPREPDGSGVLVIAVFASGPGVAIAAGLIVEVWRTRGWKSLWIVAVPLGLVSAYPPTGIVARLTMAGAVLGSVPIVILYVFFLDYYVSGLTAGAVKG